MSISTPDTRPLFRPLTADVLTVLRSLSEDAWTRPTLAPAWRVRDVVAHMLDTALRRLSYHRDRMPPPLPSRPIASDDDLTALINDLNAAWVRAAGRLSPRVLVDLYAVASVQLCDFIEALPADAPALFPVSWAGGCASEGLLDIGREFTEVWHHGAQIREATGAGPFPDPRWLGAVLGIAMHALPHAYRHVRAAPGDSLVVEITGEAGGAWTLHRDASGWNVSPGARPNPAARATMADDIAWRLFFNALPATADRAVCLDGDLELARPLLRVRSVIV
jgi:uncharacterized protein (TIGR03083 family)